MKPSHEPAADDFSALVQRAMSSPDAPPAWVRSAIDLWPQPGTGAQLLATAKAALRLLQASLSFDSWAAPALANGMRGATSDTRHLLFSAEGRDIDLRIVAAADGYALAGQVLGPDDSGEVELSGTALASRTAALDPLGEFRLDGVASGTYRLTLRLGSDAIELPPIDIGPRAP
jgi:hypothetical protein